ncbi:Limonene hydroxylase [bacterium HR08]|nr:Limonene hydroxylase [bacterium HR08]
MEVVIGSLEKIFRDAEIAARSSEAVLILGETGVGKEVLARYIHERSRRSARPFLPINCAAIPTHLLESELFGYERGAFTGATRSRKGLLEEAEGGTVFLDEVVEIPPDAQAKLLRAIETKRVRPLGSARDRPIDVRFIAATNADIKQKVERGEFRRDLYYRLSIFVYVIPPIRERPQDIPALVHQFLTEAGISVRLSPATWELLLCYPWPGNVRELKNALTYALARVDGEEVRPEHLPDHILARCPRPEVLREATLRRKLACFEAQLLAEALKRHSDLSAVARELGIGVRTLYRKLRRYGLSKPE